MKKGTFQGVFNYFFSKLKPICTRGSGAVFKIRIRIRVQQDREYRTDRAPKPYRAYINNLNLDGVGEELAGRGHVLREVVLVVVVRLPVVVAHLLFITVFVSHSDPY